MNPPHDPTLTRIVPLDSVRHADVRVAPPGRAGDAVNQVGVFVSEFEAVAREFAIVFGRDADDAVTALALLGLDAGENLFVDDGRWTSRYVPALLARGPFSIGLRDRDDGGREAMVHLDLDHPAVGAADGEPLFLKHGGEALALTRATAVLRTIHVGHAAQEAMIAAFVHAGLLAAVKLEIAVDATRRYDLLDFMTVDAAVLAGLDGATLARLHGRGFLLPAVHAAASLGNIPYLIALKRRAMGAA